MNEGELLTALREKLKNIEAPGTLTFLYPFTKGLTFIFQDLRTQSQTLMISTMNKYIYLVIYIDNTYKVKLSM